MPASRNSRRLALAWTAFGCVRCATATAPGASARELGDGGGASSDASAVGLERPETEATLAQDALANGSDASTGGAIPCAALPLCDGFEADAVGGPPSASLWSVTSPDCSGSGTLAVDASEAHSGTHSVKVNGGGGYCDHVFIANTSAMAALGSEIYARLFIRLAAPLGAGHVAFLAMEDLADNGDDVRMGGQDAVLDYNRQSDDATLPVLSPTGVSESVAVTPNVWTCVEFHIDETAGTIDTWVDGAEVPGLVENGTPTPDVSTQWLSRAWTPKLADFRLGWESYAGQAMTLWFDDVALGAQRIGCGT